jgi:nucleotide-binding universal stress UspA family protein
MKILVATDGSEYSVIALRSMANRPWPKGSEVKVLSVPEPFVPMNVLPYFESKEIADLNTSALKEAKKFVDAGAKILSKLDAKVSTGTPFPQESPARVIAKEAQGWGAQMIVLGSHGRRGFDRLTMGSVSEHVAFHAHCSVEVIRGRRVPGKGSGKGESQ